MSLLGSLINSLILATWYQEKFVTPEWVSNFKINIASAPLVMIDANLSSPALVASCKSELDTSYPTLTVTLFKYLWCE